MKTNFKILFTAIVLTFALASCNKTPDFDTPDPTPKTEQTVTQKFGMTIDSKVSPMNTKSWNVLTWQPEYSPTAVNLVVTGTGNSIGVNYTKSCTVAELKSPTGITLDMLAGTYNVKYETVHTQANGYSLNGWSLEQLTSANKTVGQYLDIKIDNDVIITGSPLNLVATLQDALIVADINGVDYAERHTSSSGNEAICSYLLNSKYATEGIYYGYVNTQPLYITLHNPNWSPTIKVVDLTTALNGNAYHLVTPFNAAVVLNIPNLEAHQIIVP